MSNDKQPLKSDIVELIVKLKHIATISDCDKFAKVVNEFADQQTKALNDELTQVKEQLVKTTEILIDSQKVCRKSITDNAILIGKNTWLECQLNEVKEHNKQLAEALQEIQESVYSISIKPLTDYQKQTK
jgi:hypothetical protein